jgi:hypothetical protein
MGLGRARWAACARRGSSCSADESNTTEQAARSRGRGSLLLLLLLVVVVAVELER